MELDGIPAVRIVFSAQSEKRDLIYEMITRKVQDQFYHLILISEEARYLDFVSETRTVVKSFRTFGPEADSDPDAETLI